MDDLADRLLQKGIWLSKVGQLPEAEEALRDALARVRSRALAERIIGELAAVLGKLGREAEVVDLYADQGNRYPLDASPIVDYAARCWALDCFAEALRAVDVARNAMPASAAVRRLQAEILFFAGDTRGALTCCQNAAGDAGIMELASARDLCALGLIAAVLQDYSTAIMMYQLAVERDESHAFPLVGLGDALAAAGDRARAQRAFSRAIAREPASVDARLGMASWMLCNGQLVDARQAYSSEVERHPDSAMANFGLGICHYRIGDYANAVLCLRRAVDIEPSHAGASIYLAHSLTHIGDYSGAVQVLHWARDLDPDDPRPADLLLFLSAKRNEPERAVEIFRTLIAREPDNANYHYSLGEALSQLKRYNEAVEALTEALRLNPKKKGAHVLLGCAYQMLDEHGRALEAYAAAIDLYKDPSAYLDAGYLLWLRGDRSSAREHWKQAMKFGEPAVRRSAWSWLGHTSWGMQAILRTERSCAGALARVKSALSRGSGSRIA